MVYDLAQLSPVVVEIILKVAGTGEWKVKEKNKFQKTGLGGRFCEEHCLTTRNSPLCNI